MKFTYLDVFITFKSVCFVSQVVRVEPLVQGVVQTKLHFWITKIAKSFGELVWKTVSREMK